MEPLALHPFHPVNLPLPPEIPEPNPDQKKIYEEAFELAMDVPDIRETLVETFSKTSKGDFKFQNEMGIPGGALNPNLSGNKLVIPEGLSRAQTALSVARQLGFAAGKKNLFKNKIDPKPDETMDQFKGRFIQKFLEEIVLPGIQFELSCADFMLNEHGYRIHDFNQIADISFNAEADYRGGAPLFSYLLDKAGKTFEMQLHAINIFLERPSLNARAVIQDMDQFATEVFLKGWPQNPLQP